MPKSFLQNIPYLLFMALSASSVVAQSVADRFQIMPYIGLQGYRWEEFPENVRINVKENGTRPCAGVFSRLSLLSRKSFYTELHFQYTWGTVGYDGYRVDQQQGMIPYTAKTAYSDFEGIFSFGYTFKLSKRLLFAPVAGFETEYWIRNLDYRGANGYTERYLAPSASLGISLTYVPNNRFQVYSACCVSLPLEISESFKLAQQDQEEPIKLVLHPGINPRLKAEGGIGLYRVFAAITFETWTLSRSDSNRLYYQPKTTRRQFGLRVGYSIGLLK